MSAILGDDAASTQITSISGTSSQSITELQHIYFHSMVLLSENNSLNVENTKNTFLKAKKYDVKGKIDD